MRRNSRAWSSAVIVEPPHTGCGMNCRIPARRASALSAASPTRAWMAFAARLSERRTIGSSSAFSAARSARARTSVRRRYATSSIALTTLAERYVVVPRQLHACRSVRTAKLTSPARPAA